jgi:hypothetical protein
VLCYREVSQILLRVGVGLNREMIGVEVTLGTYPLFFSLSSLIPCRLLVWVVKFFGGVSWEQGSQTKGSPTSYTLVTFIVMYLDEMVSSGESIEEK